MVTQKNYSFYFCDLLLTRSLKCLTICQIYGLHAVSHGIMLLPVDSELLNRATVFLTTILAL